MPKYCNASTLKKLILSYRKDKKNIIITNELYFQFKAIIQGVISGTKLKNFYSRDSESKDLVELTISHLFEIIDKYNSRKNAFTYFSVVAKRYLNRAIYTKFTENSKFAEYSSYAINSNTLHNSYEAIDINEIILFDSIKKKLSLKKVDVKSYNAKKMSYYKYQHFLKLNHLLDTLISSQSYDIFLSMVDRMDESFKTEIYDIIKELL